MHISTSTHFILPSLCVKIELRQLIERHGAIKDLTLEIKNQKSIIMGYRDQEPLMKRVKATTHSKWTNATDSQ